MTESNHKVKESAICMTESNHKVKESTICMTESLFSMTTFEKVRTSAVKFEQAIKEKGKKKNRY